MSPAQPPSAPASIAVVASAMSGRRRHANSACACRRRAARCRFACNRRTRSARLRAATHFSGVEVVPLCESVAERLGGASAAGTPPVGLAGFHLDLNGDFCAITRSSIPRSSLPGTSAAATGPRPAGVPSGCQPDKRKRGPPAAFTVSFAGGANCALHCSLDLDGMMLAADRLDAELADDRVGWPAAGWPRSTSAPTTAGCWSRSRASAGFHVVDSFSRIVRLGEGLAATGGSASGHACERWLRSRSAGGSWIGTGSRGPAASPPRPAVAARNGPEFIRRVRRGHRHRPRGAGPGRGGAAGDAGLPAADRPRRPTSS